MIYILKAGFKNNGEKMTIWGKMNIFQEFNKIVVSYNK